MLDLLRGGGLGFSSRYEVVTEHVERIALTPGRGKRPAGVSRAQWAAWQRLDSLRRRIRRRRGLPSHREVRVITKVTPVEIRAVSARRFRFELVPPELG